MSTPRPSDTIAKALAERYRDSIKALNEYRDSMFPRGAKVCVDADQYRGPGIVAMDSNCRPDQLPVLLSNGNTWWYPIERCWLAEPSEPELRCQLCLRAQEDCGCSELDINPDFGAKG